MGLRGLGSFRATSGKTNSHQKVMNFRRGANAWHFTASWQQKASSWACQQVKVRRVLAGWREDGHREQFQSLILISSKARALSGLDWAMNPSSLCWC